jgi:hypothetical protein
MSLKPSTVIEDNLDRVKVLHELGMREDAAHLLKAINNQIAGDTLNSQVVRRYIAQESQQREDIHFTAKELNAMAVEHFQKNRLTPALDVIDQALKLSPDNLRLLFSKLKILIKIKQEDQDTPATLTSAKEIIESLLQQNLEGKNLAVFEELVVKWQSLV